jgi:dihydropyrimidine dehydrogenase (NADP+)/dihydropyrimidine dehydrogenase (NAD+) subunit PreA
MEIAQVIADEFPDRSLSGIGGIETGGDAAQFILLGADTVQVCTGVMKMGYGCIRPMCDELESFMDRHNFRSISDFKGYSLKFFTTHADLVARQAAAKAAERAKHMVTADEHWSGDEFVKQSDALSRG